MFTQNPALNLREESYHTLIMPTISRIATVGEERDKR